MAKPHYCSNCGADFNFNPGSTKQATLLEVSPSITKCSACHYITYRNPLPVIVCLLGVTDGERTGLLLVRRKDGRWALPGGYIGVDDVSFGVAASRELWEETGVRVAKDGWMVFDTRYAFDSGTVLIFVDFIRMIPVIVVGTPPENPEVDAMDFLWSPDRELAFPLHSLAAQDWFRRASVRRLTKR